MNYSDSERIASFLEKNNYHPTSNINEASLVIFNTCGVRQMAEDRVYGQIHNIRVKSSKSKVHKVQIVLTGCLANRRDVQRRLKNKVDLFFPIKEFDKFENFVIENSLKIENLKLKISEQENNIPDKENIAYLSITPKHNNKYQALVPIMTGCNNFCAYCVVPYARGREVSRSSKEIIAEIQSLVKKGYKEITLLGQNVNSYRYKYQITNEKLQTNSKSKISNSKKEVTFSQLLKKIDSIPGKFWIRFVSNHPKDVTEEMIEAVTKCKKVCESFHLPIQAGNDAILKRMNRRYTAQEYLSKAKKIQSAFKKNKPGIPAVITSDIIVGFPGETKNQFIDSAAVMEKVGFDMVYFGQFSPRPGTAAWKMKDNVSKKEKGRREQFLNEILKKSALKNSQKFLNTKTEVLIDKKSDDFYFGKTRTGKNVKIVSTKKDLVGKIVKAKIIKANIWNLEGIII